MLLERQLAPKVLQALDDSPAVVLIGPRQVGKTTLALEIGHRIDTHYLDLESRAGKARMSDPATYLSGFSEQLVILDEVQQIPELFGELRGLIDAARRSGRRKGQFLLLGSASLELLRQSYESLAGRTSHLELTPLMPDEIDDIHRLWLRGGYPDSYLARSDTQSMRWRTNLVKTYLEREIPQLGPRVPAETLRRFWTMLAHSQSGLLNASAYARGLGVSYKTISSYIDLLVDLLLVRRLPAWSGNVGKRLVKSPKVFVRDSGLVHNLLNIPDRETLLGHPVVGGSWEGFVIEALLSAVPEGTLASYYRSQAGAECDLVLELPGSEVWAIEIKRSSAPKIRRGFWQAVEDIHATRRILVYPGSEDFPMRDDVQALSLLSALQSIRSLK